MSGTLFDLPPNVRPLDPDTSRLAASLEHAPLRARVRHVLEHHPAGLTDWEITDLLGEPHRRKPSVAKRRQEVGAVDTGQRRQSPDHQPCIVWRLAS